MPTKKELEAKIDELEGRIEDLEWENQGIDEWRSLWEHTHAELLRYKNGEHNSFDVKTYVDAMNVQHGMMEQLKHQLEQEKAKNGNTERKEQSYPKYVGSSGA